MKNQSWSLRRVKLNNILGFLGTKEIIFHDGLQVIEASNHTGKTSLALAMIWGLTGRLPEIGRITSNQFKIKNKQAQEKEKASIEIELENFQGKRLIIRRNSKSGVKTAGLSVILNDEIFEDVRAQEIIEQQLGLKPASLEGCCVVLQDQRLSLITGDLKKSSMAIHDILGLSMLSKLVPIINDKLSDLSKLIKNFEGVDPLLKWTEQHQRLELELAGKEREAEEKGFDRGIFKTSDLLKNAFSGLCKALEIENITDKFVSKDCVAFIREEIGKKRRQNPHSGKIQDLSIQLKHTKDVIGRIERARHNLLEAHENYNGLFLHYKVAKNNVAGQLSSLDKEIALKKDSLSKLKEQDGLFAHALALLKRQSDANCCPLCQQPAERGELLGHIQNRINESIRTIIEKQEMEIKDLESLQMEMAGLQDQYRKLESDIMRWLEDLLASLDHLKEQFEVDCAWFKQKLNDELLEDMEIALNRIDQFHSKLKDHYAKVDAEHVQESGKASRYNEIFRPLEERLDKIALYLIPVHEAQRKLLEHEKRKNDIENQGQEFRNLISKAKLYESNLKEFKSYLQSQEKEKANQAIKEHGDFVSRFFIKVANNPNYDKISITAEEDRGSIKYDFEALSTHSPHFTDAAKHVLSGGDLSCACLGLLLSLTQGKANKAGFLMLDDPGESFDNERLSNFANALPSLAGQQTIILTHQNELAELLRKNGAKSITL